MNLFYNNGDYYPENVNLWQWVVTVLVVIALFLLGYYLLTYPEPTPSYNEKEYCEQGSWRMSELPVKCFKYYGLVPPSMEATTSQVW